VGPANVKPGPGGKLARIIYLVGPPAILLLYTLPCAGYPAQPPSHFSPIFACLRRIGEDPSILT
jgi:hypothetical protein